MSIGGVWTGLTYECVRYIVDQMHNNQTMRHYFQTCYVPDELSIPTIVFNSKFASRAHLLRTDANDLPLVTPLHYIDYSCGILSYSEKDFDMLMNSGKVFVRKLVTGKSEQLIEMINQSYDKE